VQPELLNSHSTLDGVLDAIADKRDNGHFRTSFSGDNEWHTPAALLAPVRQALGEIDLDPASNAVAQQQVCAGSYFTKEDNALIREWRGKIFMNPPFAFPLIEQFIDKLLEELGAGRVTEAIVLTNNFSDTRWFHKAARAATAICFTKGRVRFESPNGDSAQPTQGQSFFYFGAHLARFRAAFADQGIIMRPDAGGEP
jgi:phage N-6-adenine-methyltransferase